MKVAVVTDSTAYLTAEEREQEAISMLPLSVIFGQEVFREEIDIDAVTFYEKVRNSAVFPTSSQPTVGVVYELFEELAKTHDAIIVVTLSSAISGTYQTAVTVAEELKDTIPIYVVDSETSCAVQARIVRLANKLAKEGVEAQEIVRRCQVLVEESAEFFIVDDLSNLQRGGRLSAGAAMVGSLLKIKPILTFEGKSIVPFEKIRTQQKAMKRIEQLFVERTDSHDGAGYDIAIIHANCQEKAEKWLEEVRTLYPKAQVSIAYFGPVIGTHLGEGALGFTWARTLDQY